MNNILSKAQKIEKVVEVHFDPNKLTELVEELIYQNLEIEVTVHHDFDEVERYNNYYLIIDTMLLEDEEISAIENYFNSSVYSIYEMTLSIINNLFHSLETTSYVKLIDSMVYDTSAIVVEFTPENYNKLINKLDK